MSDGPKITWSCHCGFRRPENNCPHFRQCTDKVMRVDGAVVRKNLLTPEELERWFPQEFHDRWGEDSLPCPVCLAPVSRTNRASLMMHTRNLHPEWWRANRRLLMSMKGPKELEAFLRDYRSRGHDHPGAEPSAQRQPVH
jgi:hypothetical protein